MSPPVTVRTSGTNTPLLDLHLPNRDSEQHVLCISDLHWDNPHCDRKLLHKHLKLALERNAPILVIGDFFCAMQGKYDPRSSKSDIRPEHNVPHYLDALVETAVEDMAPYAHLFAVVSPGNHETSIARHCETDLTKRLVTGLQALGSPVVMGGYSGYVQLKMHFWNTHRRSINVFYHHGAGGGGPVTKGTIQANRRAAFVGNADIVLSGHVHEAWQVEYRQHCINTAGTEYLSDQTHLCLGTYKEEYVLGKDGFHVEKGRPPKPVGGWWLRLYPEDRVVKWECVRAK